MPTCGLCFASVEALKTNTHVIPRWVLARAKENGKLISIEKKSASIRQTDFIADLVCESCENRFTEDDTFG